MTKESGRREAIESTNLQETCRKGKVPYCYKPLIWTQKAYSTESVIIRNYFCPLCVSFLVAQTASSWQLSLKPRFLAIGSPYLKILSPFMGSSLFSSRLATHTEYFFQQLPPLTFHFFFSFDSSSKIQATRCVGRSWGEEKPKQRKPGKCNCWKCTHNQEQQR